MGLRLLIKIAIATSVLLLCIGLGIFWYIKTSTNSNSGEFDLYSLVPPTAQVVIETENAIEFIHKLNELQCSKDGHFLYISHFFSYLKEHFNAVIDEAPHGFSNQMSKMLVSFHEPNDKKDQVFYFCLGKGDEEFVESFIRKYSSDKFPAKTFEYKGEEIRIYSMPDDSFLSCYFTSDFIAVSYQKKLIEEVIDSRQLKKSILIDTTFRDIQAQKSISGSAVIYLRAKPGLNAWTKFSMVMNSHAIYFSGVNNHPDSYSAFMDTVRHEVHIKGFPEDILPVSTFLFTRRPVAEFKNVLGFFPPETPITTSFFHSGDSLAAPYTVVTIPMGDSEQVRYGIQNLAINNPEALQLIFEKVTGIKGVVPYYRFYKDLAVLGVDYINLSAYIQALQKGNILSGEDLTYGESIASLSDSYNFMAMADIDKLLVNSSQYAKLIPDFFLNHEYFFRHFMVSIQFTYGEDGMLYPNVVLIYEE